MAPRLLIYLALSFAIFCAQSHESVAAPPPDAAAFIKFRQERIKVHISTAQAELKEVSQDKTLSASEKAQQTKAIQRRIANLRTTKPTIPTLRVADAPLEDGDAGTIALSGTVQKVISESSAIVEFSYRAEQQEIVVGSGKFTNPTRHAQSVQIEGISKRSAIISSSALEPGATIEFTRIMEAVSNEKGKLVLRPWTAPNISRSRPTKSPDSAK
jgi:hypothetical protein